MIWFDVLGNIATEEKALKWEIDDNAFPAENWEIGKYEIISKDK